MDEGLFSAAHDAALRRWPEPVRGVDLTSRYGTTRVHICGPEDGVPLVLLPCGGTTSVSWFANVRNLARDHRLYAVDLLAWLDVLFDELSLDGAHLCGHSYRAWIALAEAFLDSTTTVRRKAHNAQRVAIAASSPMPTSPPCAAPPTTPSPPTSTQC
ncbi:alpha/beta fold hydrolase [Actinomadura rugatobispora]|uniref:Alpha/beta fold hydrolase n=1 Tax=Actinomadura rugatobispora TaxID=1994 RepID=A0ABW1AGB9_9ACTN|nr:hypothetical protein GCM10010200_025240 [Actinomadura rugatobispora]